MNSGNRVPFRLPEERISDLHFFRHYVQRWWLRNPSDKPCNRPESFPWYQRKPAKIRCRRVRHTDACIGDIVYLHNSPPQETPLLAEGRNAGIVSFFHP